MPAWRKTTHYFDRNGMASEALSWLNAQAEYNADLDALVCAGNVTKARADTFKKRAADSASLDDFRAALRGIHAKHAGVDFPTVRELRLPR